jgi:hypothetical protein
MSQIPEEVRDIFDAGGRGLQHTGLRRANERAVLTLVAFNPGVSNAEISRLSGLAPQTVSAILVDVERAGLITRGQVLRGRRGQPATPIFLKADGRFAIGCEIGWRHMESVNALTGVLAEKIWNSAGNDGLLAGNPSQLMTQALGVGAAIVYSATPYASSARYRSATWPVATFTESLNPPLPYRPGKSVASAARFASVCSGVAVMPPWFSRARKTPLVAAYSSDLFIARAKRSTTSVFWSM